MGATVHIPSTFFSWYGHSLDFKLPLLRAERAVSEQGLKLLKTMGSKGHTHFHTDVGAEQVRRAASGIVVARTVCQSWPA
jgi:glutamine synthetase